MQSQKTLSGTKKIQQSPSNIPLTSQIKLGYFILDTKSKLPNKNLYQTIREFSEIYTRKYMEISLQRQKGKNYFTNQMIKDYLINPERYFPLESIKQMHLHLVKSTSQPQFTLSETLAKCQFNSLQEFSFYNNPLSKIHKLVRIQLANLKVIEMDKDLFNNGQAPGGYQRQQGNTKDFEPIQFINFIYKIENVKNISQFRLCFNQRIKLKQHQQKMKRINPLMKIYTKHEQIVRDTLRQAGDAVTRAQNLIFRMFGEIQQDRLYEAQFTFDLRE